MYKIGPLKHHCMLYNNTALTAVITDNLPVGLNPFICPPGLIDATRPQLIALSL